MPNYQYMKLKYLFMMILPLMIGILSSCSDDDNSSSGVPEITGVRITDPDKADSLFTTVTRGNMIVLVGHNLDGAQHLYINDQEVSFNANYNTSTHLIATVPGDLTVYGEDQTIRKEIRLVTSHGSCTYAFSVVAGEPVIDYYQVELTELPDGTYAVVPGQPLDIYGSLFHEVESVYLTDMDTVVCYPMQSWTVNETSDHITVTMPETIVDKGYIVVKAFAGTAYYGFAKGVAEPEITDISSDCPILGSKVTIYGKNLLEVLDIDVCGEFTIPAEEITTSPDQSWLSFIMPQLPENGGKLTLHTMGGRASVNVYNYDLMLIDYDGHEMSHGWGWYTSTVGKFNKAPTTPPATHSGEYIGFEGQVGWWWGNANYNGMSSPTAIPASTPTSEIELRFEVYLQHEVQNGGHFSITYLDLTHHGRDDGQTPIADHISGNTPVGEWFTVAVPASDLTNAATYGDWCALNTGGDNFMVYTRHSDVGHTFHIYLDNFRLYVKP